MSKGLKRWLPVVAAISLLAVLSGFVFVSKARRQMTFDSGETSLTVEAALSELQALRPSSLDDPQLRQALDKFRLSRYVVSVWLIRPDGQIAFSNARLANRGQVDEYATEETRRILSEMPEDFLTPPQKTALLAASAIQSEGEHNDIYRQMIRPLRAGDDSDLGFVGVSYDVSPEPGKFPGIGYAVALFAIPLGLAVYGLALAWWAFLDAKARGERAWVWALFVVLGNLVALFAYLLARQPQSGMRQRNVPDAASKSKTETLLPLVIALAVLTAGVPSTGSAFQTEAQKPKNGTILETRDGLPYKTYEEWLSSGRSLMAFDEARIRAQFPPEKSKDNKDKLHIPAATYEEWLTQLKRRSDAIMAKWPEIEAETRRNYPPKMFQEFKETVDCARIVYSSDGLKIAGFILKPRALAAGRHPVVIYNHGGNSRLGGMDDTSLLRLGWIVRAGYVVVASQYRGCEGSEGHDEIGGADIDDVLNLIPLIESLPYADPARIGMLGWSRGGMMTYLTLAQSCRIAAAVIGSAPSDLLAEIDKRPVMGSLLQASVPSYEANKETVLKARSAKYWPEKLCKTTPILILQGADDQRCVAESALELGLQLQRLGRPFRLIFFESGSHGLSEHQEEVNSQTIAWFEKYLRR